MKKLRGKVLTAGMISLLLLASTTIFAQRGRGYMQGQRGPGSAQAECRIPDLTEDQQEQINTLRTEHWNEMDEFRTDMRILRAEMKDLTSGSDYDVKAADKKIEEISEMKEKMMKAQLNHRDEVRSLLTDEQKVFFDKHHPGKGNGFGKGHGPRGHRGQGRYDCPNNRGPRW
jgi:Spy/CpxP family protein refolding chaperone